MSKLDIPKSWRVTPLEAVADIQTGIAKGKNVDSSGVTLPYLRVANVQDGRVDLAIIKEIRVRQSEVTRFSLRLGDVLFTEGGDFDKLGRGAVWRAEIDPCLHQNHIFAVRPNAAILLPELLAYHAASDQGRRYFQLSSKQSTNLASINSTQLKRFPVLLPPLAEQHKIVDILRTWDEAIEKLDRLLGLLTTVRSAVGQGIFEKDFVSGDTLLRAREVFTPVSERARPDLPLLAVMQDLGIVRREDLDRRVTMPDGDTSTYKVVRPGDFVISLRSFEGGLEYSNVLGLVSPAYTVLRAKQPICAEYYRHFFKSRSFIGRLDKMIFGIRDGKQIAFRDFGDMLIPYPPIEDQVQDQKVLDTAALLIEAHLLRKQAFESQKRGLMQKLLTGQWRVSC